MPIVYIGLSTADPLDTAAGLAEPSGSGYTRVVTSAATWQTAASGATHNILAIIFPTATGSWGTATHFAGFDALSGGNMLWHSALTVSKVIISGQTPTFAVGDLDISVD